MFLMIYAQLKLLYFCIGTIQQEDSGGGGGGAKPGGCSLLISDIDEWAI